jgi:cell division protein FtsZ
MVKEGLINLDFADVRAVMREMGKAMMGTGEASGEKRAITAAEAAIANPLIDDNTMKGAKGLLISITGGKDLTLYEVDEAATRIREEVDKDANIIVGATFDDSLEGIIRVAVVATGVDRPAMAAKPPVESVKRAAHEIPRPMERPRQVAAAPAPAPAPAAAHSIASIDAAATAAVAAALGQDMLQDIGQAPAQETAIEDVTIRPTPPKPSLFVEPAAQPPASPPESFGNFIPPHPERVPQRPRMPRIDELPPQAQREIQAHRGELPQPEPEKQRMSLLKRLASAGLGLKAEAEEPQMRQDHRPMAAPQPMQRMPQQMPPMPQRPPSRPMEGRDPVSEYARRSQGPQGLDMHGRQAPVNNSGEDDQLDIPAFLRRQAN